ncbi:MAG: hypothetical protein ABR538_06425 [Candidatus Binatia bacterium]
METAAATARAGLSHPRYRLALAGTRIAAQRCGWRPSAAPPPVERTGHPSRNPSPQSDAEALDREACPLASLEAQCRLIQACVTAELLRRQLWRPLGFTRLADYAAERLGIGARTLEEDARVATALEALPAIRQAFETGAIRWTHARMLTGIATPETEGGWLRLALTSTTRGLTELLKGVRPGDPAPDDAAVGNRATAPPPPGRSAAEGAGDASPDACASPSTSRSAGDVHSARAAADAQNTQDTEDARGAEAALNTQDPPVRWSIVTTRGGRKLWRAVGDLASRMNGADVSASRVAEAVAAEALSWPHCDPPGPPPPPHRRPSGGGGEAAVRAFEAANGTSEGFRWVKPASRSQTSGLDHLLVGLTDADAHDIDSRLRALRMAMQGLDARLGAVLRRIADLRAHRALGFANLRLYAEARLGICGSKALALVRLERQCELRSPLIRNAYGEGRITWLAATALLAVGSREYEREWVERAETVTLRRLAADTSWALDRADDEGGEPCHPPPPLDLDVTADAQARIDPADVQMRAHPQADVGSFSRRVGAAIRATMPASVAALLEEAIEGCRRAVEPRWRGFERIVAHAYLAWTSLPPHENPVFARDAYRCQVPACSRRSVLHAHHVRFRSHGGPDDAWNLTAVCDDHHRHFIHFGRIHVKGRAPDGLVWELGCRPGRMPLLRLRGEVYLYKAGAAAAF